MPELKTQQVWYRPSLTTQILIGLVVGVLIGWLRPAWGNSIYFLRDIFLNLIKSIIGPLVFSTLVVGIAGGGDLRKVGRMGVKALIYFEIITTVALFLGLAVVNITKPGVGVPLVGAAGEQHKKSAKRIRARSSRRWSTSFRRAWWIRWCAATFFRSSRLRSCSRWPSPPSARKAGPCWRDGESVAGDVQAHELCDAFRAFWRGSRDGAHDRHARPRCAGQSRQPDRLLLSRR